MIVKPTLFLISVIWTVQCQDFPNLENQPLYLLKMKNIIIDGYHGRMDSKTLDLFGNVETLTFQNCNFTKFSESYVHPLINLRKVVVSNCHFDRVKDDLSTCCRNLRELDIYGSFVGALEKDWFQKIAVMRNLEILDLDMADIPILNTNCLAGSNLKTLGIKHSTLATIEDGALNGMSKLEVLNLQHSKLKTVPTGPLAALKTLKELNLKGNLLENVKTADFPSLPNLEKLNLGQNPIKEIDLKGLKEKLPNIKEVDVSGIDIDPSKAEGVPLLKTQIG